MYVWGVNRGKGKGKEEYRKEPTPPKKKKKKKRLLDEDVKGLCWSRSYTSAARFVFPGQPDRGRLTPTGFARRGVSCVGSSTRGGACFRVIRVISLSLIHI